MIDLKKLKSIAKKAITAQALREAGVRLLPILPNGTIDEATFNAYVEAGQPEGEWFGLYLLVTPEEFEERSRGRKDTPLPDPFTGIPMTPEDKEAWEALAPVKVLGGAQVPALDLVYFGASRGCFRAGVSSDLLLDSLPKGTEAVSPPRVLTDAAKRWPYSPTATADVASAKRGEAVKVKLPPVTVVAQGGSYTIPSDVTNFKALSDFLLSTASNDTLKRWAAYLGDSNFVNALPTTSLPPASYISELVDSLRRYGHTASYLDIVLSERPNYRAVIEQLKARYR